MLVNALCGSVNWSSPVPTSVVAIITLLVSTPSLKARAVVMSERPREADEDARGHHHTDPPEQEGDPADERREEGARDEDREARQQELAGRRRGRARRRGGRRGERVHGIGWVDRSECDER